MRAKQSPTASRGQAMVEVALVLPILLLVMLGILDLGRAVFASNDMSHTARDAARQASVSPLDCESIYYIVRHQTRARTDVAVSIEYRRQPSLTTTNPTWSTVTCPSPYDPSAAYDFDPTTGAPGSVTPAPLVGGEVRVTVSDEVTIATPIVSNIVGGSIGVEGDSSMTVTFVP